MQDQSDFTPQGGDLPLIVRVAWRALRGVALIRKLQGIGTTTDPF